MASGGAAVQTFVLRVSIHCHGCKKKVRKVLRNVEGVHDVKVDAAAHKVIVTGIVDAETLVKKLQKSGKQALPWQYPPAAPAKSPEEDAPPAPEEAPPAGDGGKNNDAASAEDDGSKKPEEPATKESSEKKPEQEAAAEEKKPDAAAAEKGTEPEKKAAETEEAKPRDEEAKKKEGGKSEEAAEPAKGDAGNDEAEATEKKSKPKETPAASTVDRSLPSPPMAAPKQGQYYDGYSAPYYAPQPMMSYHMAQPRASESHYAPLPEQGYSTRQQPPPYSSSSMAYSQQQQPMQQWSPSYLYMPYPQASPESYYHDYYSPPGTHAPPPLQDSYRIFDDENPNSCSVM